VLSGRDLCDGLITRPEESYRLWRVVVCDQETSKTRRLSPLPGCENTTTVGCNARKTNNNKQSLSLAKTFTASYGTLGFNILFTAANQKSLSRAMCFEDELWYPIFRKSPTSLSPKWHFPFRFSD